MKKYRFINSEESFEIGDHVYLQVLADEKFSSTITRSRCY